jgi:hypothetical protein
VTGTEPALDRLVDAGWAAVESAGRAELTVQLAGRTIRLVGAGPELIDLFAPAFAHLPTAPNDDPADLTVLLWDTASTGQPFPDLGEAGPQVGAPVRPILHDGARTFVFHATIGAVSYLDHHRGVAVYAARAAHLLPPWERPSPLRSILTWWFATQGLLLGHSAAVGSRDGAVLLTGPGGSGKSTTALAALQAGMGYLGDDYVLLDVDRVRVWSVYGSAKLEPGHLARFPHLLDPDGRDPHLPPDTKKVGWPLTARPESILLEAPIRAILLPAVVGGGHNRLAPTPASRALLALAPVTMFQTPGDHQAAFSLASRLARSVPSFRLELGGDIEELPGLLGELLSAGAP